MIISGPLYRGEISVMTILFLGTVLISGPAWCSHLCYFGGLDNFISGNGRSSKKLKNKFRIKHSVLFIVILVSLVFRWIGVHSLVALSTAVVAGIAGFFIIGKYSRKTGKMVHCSLYCPVGTVVSYYSRINPFRMYIEDDCSACMKCSMYCKYDALQKQDILSHKPGNTCTLCGDCITTCHSGSLKYRFFKMKPEISRYLYLFISISLHAICLAIARI
jgi:polyferredoxin